MATIAEVRALIAQHAPNCPECNEPMRAPDPDIEPVVTGNTARARYVCAQCRTPSGQPRREFVTFDTQTRSAHAVFVGTGEVTGLATAKWYAERMATDMTSQVSRTEMFVAFLTTVGVTGRAVEAAARAQELSAAAGEAWLAASAALRRQDTVREAYVAVPGAGTKQFVTSE
ncbi:hypothetical protein [Micromonospora sp. NPDC049662]|uniref:hypothetical protein n=1 Tax=Micromonospora sp. NPDC049662 TaxID=3155397 RepID=UPI003431EDCA